ncbi:MAG: M28 family peptidase [Akkermansiaceae bacterium]
MNAKVIGIIFVVVGIGYCVWLWMSDRADEHGKAAYAHTEKLLSFGPRVVESEGLKNAQQYLAEELSKLGWSTMSQSVVRDTPVGKRTFTNLIARYQPEKLETLEDLQKLPTKGILCAHLDSKIIPGIPDFLGADDAASACALIIELAATITQENPEMAKQLEIVFFDGEEAFGENIIVPGFNAPKDMKEDGLYGSRAYSHTLYNRKPKPQFGILLDMVGHKDLQIAVPSDSPQELVKSMNRAAKKHGHEKRFGMADQPIIDDHLYLNKAGVPTIDIIAADFAHSHWWHQEGDNMDIISAKSLTISYHVVLEMLREQLAK